MIKRKEGPVQAPFFMGRVQMELMTPSNGREAIIDVRGLNKKFGDDLLFENISFKIFQGSFTTILGLNGIGKSTLLNILSCRISPDKSEGELMGRPLGSDLGRERAAIALVSEHLNYELGATAREFSHFYAKLFPHFDRELFASYIEHRKLDLSKHYTQYSRGQRMQFCLVLALCQRPRILFVDEITSVLDYKAREFFLQEFKTFCENGGTIVLTTNIINEVQQYSTDLVIIKSSEELVWGKQEEILNQFVKLKCAELYEIPESIRASALYLGRDIDGEHLLLISREKMSEIPESSSKKTLHPNLHEVFSYLTQQF